MRTTVQTTIIREELGKRGHATNRELWQAVTARIPGITLSSVHRTTQRLRNEGIIGCTPVLQGESMLDSNPQPHTHFMCRSCKGMIDIDLPDAVITSIQDQVAIGTIEKSLFIAGQCSECPNKQ